MISFKNTSFGGDLDIAGTDSDVCLQNANIGGNANLSGVKGIIDLKGAFIRGSVDLTKVILISDNLEGARFGEILYDNKTTTFLDSKTGRVCHPIVRHDTRGEYFEFI